MRSFTLPSILIILFSSRARSDDTLVEPTSKDNSNQCGCYLASGPDPGYFQYYRFWDFRDVPNDGNNDYANAPALLTEDVDGNEAVTSSFFNSSSFTADWTLASGKQNRNSPLTAIDTAQNLYMTRNSTSGAESSTFLTLRVQRFDTTVATCEMDSNQKNVLHSSIRGRFRVIPSISGGGGGDVGDFDFDAGGPGTALAIINDTHPVDGGAVFGLFTYKSDTQESDIEVLTSDPINIIRYSNQPDYDAKTDQSVPGASTPATMPEGTVWTEWQDHRIDWFDGISRWYVNDQLVLEKTLNVPTEPSSLILNLWSDGGNWSGNMTVGEQVTVGVQWIEMAFNTSGTVTGKREVLHKRKENQCSVGCNIDSVAKVGFPEVAFNNPSSTGTILRLHGQDMLRVWGMATLIGLLLSYL